MSDKVTFNLTKKVFNAKYIPLLGCETRYLALYGGAGSGKSVFIVQRYLLRLLEEEGRNLLVVRAVSTTNRDSTFAAFKQIISAWELEDYFRVGESDMRIRVCNGNTVVFKGLDDSEKLKSITFERGILTDIWIEEASEISQSDFTQLDIRLRGNGPKKQIVVSFNPTDINHWLKREIVDKGTENITVVHGTYLDNAFLDDEYKNLLEGYKRSDPYYYSVYCLGQWGVFGESVFNAERLSERLNGLTQQPKKGNFVFRYDGTNIFDSLFEESADGCVYMYDEPEKGENYIIGADTAGDGSDSSVACVMARTSGKQVAVLRKKLDEGIFARQLFCLGKFYNNALIAVETNFSTYPVRELERLGYENQYVRLTEDDFTHLPTHRYGFKTTAVTRPVIIGELIDFISENISQITDRTTLEEMLTFVRNKKGRPEAQSGAHDDCVMALAIACHVRASVFPNRKKGPKKNINWTQDMIEDYSQGSIDERKEMERLWWGNR